MMNSRPLSLSVAGKKDFDLPIRILSLLVLYSAALSPQPVLMTLFVLLLLGAGWLTSTLRYSNICGREVTLTLFPDGQARLTSDDETVVEGIVQGRFWCTQWLTVLSIATQNKSQNLLLLSGQQTTGEYRRLIVWLKQDIFAIKTEGRVQSWPTTTKLSGNLSA